MFVLLNMRKLNLECLRGKTWENWKLSQFKGNSSLVARNSPIKVNKWGIRGLNPGSYILQHPYQLSYAHRTGSSFYYLGLNIFVECFKLLDWVICFLWSFCDKRWGYQCFWCLDLIHMHAVLWSSPFYLFLFKFFNFFVCFLRVWKLQWMMWVIIKLWQMK